MQPTVFITTTRGKKLKHTSSISIDGYTAGDYIADAVHVLGVHADQIAELEIELREVVPPPFRVDGGDVAFDGLNKSVRVIGPNELVMDVEYDDVDQHLVRAAVETMVRVLNDHWPFTS